MSISILPACQSIRTLANHKHCSIGRTGKQQILYQFPVSIKSSLLSFFFDNFRNRIIVRWRDVASRQNHKSFCSLHSNGFDRTDCFNGSFQIQLPDIIRLFFFNFRFYFNWLGNRFKQLMPQGSHDYFCIINELLQFAFFFFCNITRRRIISIFDLIAIRLQCQITETVFKIAYLSGSK